MFDLRALRYFVTVAETGSVARAAEILHLSQSPLSRQIIQFEAELGLNLFERINRRLSLTSEGEVFLERARQLLADAERLRLSAGRMAKGQDGILRIGYVDGAVGAGLVERLVNKLGASHSDIRLEFHRLGSRQQVEALADRKIDLGLAYSSVGNDIAGLERIPVLDVPLCVAWPMVWGAAGESLEPHHLHLKRWIAFPQTENPALRLRFEAACQSCGFTPSIAHETNDQTLVFALVRSGAGAAFVQARADREVAGVRFYPAEWFPMRVKISALVRAKGGFPWLKGNLAGLAT